MDNYNWLPLTMLANYRQRDLLYEAEQERWARECREPFCVRVKHWVLALLAASLVAVLIWQMA